jgi:hypothetical protein
MVRNVPNPGYGLAPVAKQPPRASATDKPHAPTIASAAPLPALWSETANEKAAKVAPRLRPRQQRRAARGCWAALVKLLTLR